MKKASNKLALLLSMAFCTIISITACGITPEKKSSAATTELTPGKSNVIASHSKLSYNWKKIAFADTSNVRLSIDEATITPNTDGENWRDAFLLAEDSEKQSTVFSVTADCTAHTLRINNAVFYDQPQGRGNPFSIKISNGDFVAPKDKNETELIRAVCPQPQPNLHEKPGKPQQKIK